MSNEKISNEYERIESLVKKADKMCVGCDLNPDECIIRLIQAGLIGFCVGGLKEEQAILFANAFCPYNSNSNNRSTDNLTCVGCGKEIDVNDDEDDDGCPDCGGKVFR